MVQLLSCEFWEISKNTFFTEHIRATASAARVLFLKGIRNFETLQREVKTAWKLSVFRVILVHIFPHLEWIRLRVLNIRIENNLRKFSCISFLFTLPCFQLCPQLGTTYEPEEYFMQVILRFFKWYKYGLIDK